MLRPFRLLLLPCLLVFGAVGPAPADDVAGVDNASWPELVARKTEALQRLLEIRQVLESRTERPSREQAETLIEEYNSLVKELQTSLYPRMNAAAEEVLKQEELSDDDANQIGDLAVRMFRNNNFQEASELADQVLDKRPENAIALNAAGAAHFALQDFEQAAQLLAQAREKGEIIRSIGGPFVDVAEPYVGYWQHEQALRSAEDAAEGDQALPRVLLETSRGDILLELFENEAPNTVANFISLVESQFYDGTKFHRVIPGFMAQGGDPNSKDGAAGQPGTGGPGYVIDCECYQPDSRRHFAGSLSMAHAGKDTGGSQFFITHLPTPHLDADVAPESVHTVFGRVVEGMDVVLDLEQDDVIESATVVRKRNHDYTPETHTE
jgi:cyclophilin family peptidyl-prolyl cis-trans isomerase